MLTPILVTGIIPAAGVVPVAGTGFTYTHVNGSGQYAFTFAPAFPATPAVAILPIGNALLPWLLGVGPGSFTVNFVTLGNVPTDTTFSFFAHAVV